MSDHEHRGPAPDDEGPWTDEEIESWSIPVDPAQNTEAHRMRRLREGTIWGSGTPAEEIAVGTTARAGLDDEKPEPVTWLDPAGGQSDDGEERNWDGQTRGEFLEMLQEAHDNGSVLMENDFWMDPDDAASEVGAEEVARLRAEMAAYLEREWAALDTSE